MRKISLNVQKEFCDECSLALRRFIGKMDGVNSIDTEDGRIMIDFDDSKLTEGFILKISRESSERLFSFKRDQMQQPKSGKLLR